MFGLKNLKLSGELRMSTGALVIAVMAGTIFASWEIHQTEKMSASVLEQQMPMLDAVRSLRVNTFRSASSLKSFMLFGMDPGMGTRFKQERAESWSGLDKALTTIRTLEQQYDYGTDRALIDQTVAEIAAIRSTQDKVERMAVGQGNDATGQAYEMLRTELASHESRATALINDAVERLQTSTSENMRSMDSAGRQEIVVLWLSTVIGLLVGGVFSHQLARRIVRSIISVVERTQAIAGGDLTGDPLMIDSQDEIAQLAQGINSMQQNLHKVLLDMVEIADSVHDASKQLSNSARSNFDRTLEQTRQTQMAAAAMQEMSASISEVSQHAHNAAGSARETSETAKQGGSIVERALDSMKTIADSVRSTASTVQRLGKESEQVNHIVNVIEEIASKTNLLALNATIEAARAGEAGRGFAVVADEVRRLAESTRNATSEIGHVIEGIRMHTLEAMGAMEIGTEKVEQGVSTTTRAGEALERIIHMADHVDGMIAQIATASTQQAAGAQQSSENLDVIHRLSNDAAATIPATQQTLGSVEQEVARLQKHISRFQLSPKH